MKVDVKEYLANDGSSISIESGDELPIVNESDKFVGITTNNIPEFVASNELWIFKRKAFLKAVAKALNVCIYEQPEGVLGGYYR